VVVVVVVAVVVEAVDLFVVQGKVVEMAAKNLQSPPWQCKQVDRLVDDRYRGNLSRSKRSREGRPH
jgi:hypothetical protein